MNKKLLPITHYEKYIKHLKMLTCDNIIEKLSDAEMYDDILNDYELYRIFLENIKIPPIGINQSLTSNILSQVYLTHRHQKFYHFEKDITELLTQTSLRKMDVDLIKSPYPCIYLSIPYNKNLTIYNKDTGKHIVEGIYVYFKEIDQDLVRQYPAMPQDTKAVLRCLMVGRGKPETSPYGEYDDALNFTTMFLGEGDIFEQIDLDIKRKQEEGHIEECYDIPGIRKIHLFVINALLYITSAQARLDFYRTRLPNEYNGKKSKKLRHAEKENKNFSNVNEFCNVGENIVIRHPTIGSAVSTGTGIKLTSQTKVHPHWQWYWIGKGRSIRKHVFKLEYIKGKEFAESLLSNAKIIVK